jgi:hypothetical protein
VSWPSRPKSSPTPLREIQILLWSICMCTEHRNIRCSIYDKYWVWLSHNIQLYVYWEVWIFFNKHLIWKNHILSPKTCHILDSGHVAFTCRLFNATVFSHERWLMKFCGRLYNIAFLKTVIVMLTAFRTWSVTSVSLCFFFRSELCKRSWEFFRILFVWTLNIIVGIGTGKVEENESVAVLPTYCLQKERVRLCFLFTVSKWRQ